MPEYQNVVLARLDQIYQSLDELRKDFHDKMLAMGSELAAMRQWKHDQVRQVDANTADIVMLKRSRDEMRGALKAIAFLEALLAAILGYVGWLHFGKG